MSLPRFVETPDGPAVIIPAGAARLVHAHLGRLLAERPAGVPNDPVLHPLARLCSLVEQQHAAGVGFTHETDPSAESVQLLTPQQVASETGVSAQTVTKRCRLGLIPGAQQIDGRWVIPAAVLEDEHDAAA